MATDISADAARVELGCYREKRLFLMDHMHRIRVLDIEICDAKVNRSLWSALQQPAPQLQVLRIADGGFFISGSFSTIKFLSSNAPQLRTCFFSGSNGLEGTFNMCSQFPSIRTLVFLSCVGWPEIVTAFTMFPLLEKLSIGVASWYDTEDPYDEGPPLDVPRDVRALLAAPASMNLRSLCIICRDPLVPACVLSAIEHNQIETVAIKYDGGFYPNSYATRCAASNLVQVLSPGAASAVAISFSRDPNVFSSRRNRALQFSIRLESSDGRIRVHHELQLEIFQDVLSQLPHTTSSMTLTNLHRLRVDNADTDSAWTTPDLQLPSSIRSLTVVVHASTLKPKKRDGVSSRWLLTPVVQLSDPDCIAFALPQDEVTADSTPAIVPAERLIAFLRDTVQRTTTRRLPCVRLQGLRVNDVSALEDIADKILLEPPLRSYVAPEDDVLTFDSWPYT